MKQDNETDLERHQRRIAVTWWTAILVLVCLAGLGIGLWLLP